MLRWLKYRSLLLRREHPVSKNTWLARLLHSDLVAWNRTTVSRGVAIGMFWCFIPIPLQMFPAALFCWFMRANLPVAILCVWISNPLTWAPMLLFEYRFGEWLYHMFISELPAEIAPNLGLATVLAGGFRNVLLGGIVTSCIAMVVGYVTILIAFILSSRARDARARKKQAKNVTD